MLLSAGILLNGCALFHHHRNAPVPPPSATSGSPFPPAAPGVAIHPIITPDNSLSAKVAAYNSTGRFVVLTFPVGPMPGIGQTFFLYRNGLKMAEIKITGPQNDNNVVADLLSGTAEVGDEVREQ